MAALAPIIGKPLSFELGKEYVIEAGKFSGVKIHIELVAITPRVAEQMLSFNGVNRALSNNRVQQITEDMESGIFTFVGDPIRVFTVTETCESYLLDGQHRLWAICERNAKEPIPFLVIYLEGRREDMIRAMTVIDKGAARSLNQDIQISRKMGDVTYRPDFSNRAISLSVNALFYVDKVIMEGANRSNKHVSVPMKEAHALAHVTEVSFLSEAVDTYRKYNKSDPATGWMAGLLIAYRVSPKRAAYFWQAVSCGVDHRLIFTQSPAFVLHDLMQKPLNVIMAKQDNGTRIVKSASLFVKMWNAHVAGRTVKGWRLDDTFPEAQPHPDEQFPISEW